LIEACGLGAEKAEVGKFGFLSEKLMKGRFPSNTKNRTIMLTHRFIDKPL